jgi:hypothetical protein
VFITEKTNKIRQNLLSLSGNWVKELTKDFSTTDYLQLMDLLERLESNARSALFPKLNKTDENLGLKKKE